MPPRCILSIARQNTRGAAHNTPANATRAKHHGKAAKTGKKAKLGSAQNGVALGAHAGAATRAGILAGLPPTAQISISRAMTACHPSCEKISPHSASKPPQKPAEISPYFFPYADIFPYTADVTQSHKRPTVQCINARLCTAGNANLQFKSGCHLHINETV